MASKAKDEDIGEILDRTPKVRDSLGGFWGPLVMIYALGLSRNKGRWMGRIIIAAASLLGGARYGGFI